MLSTIMNHPVVTVLLLLLLGGAGVAIVVRIARGLEGTAPPGDLPNTGKAYEPAPTPTPTPRPRTGGGGKEQV